MHEFEQQPKKKEWKQTDTMVGTQIEGNFRLQNNNSNGKWPITIKIYTNQGLIWALVSA